MIRTENNQRTIWTGRHRYLWLLPLSVLLAAWMGIYVLADMPQRWYAGDYGRKPTVRSQGSYGTCWALTAAAALETMLLPDQQLEFSAEHMVLNSGFSTTMEDGGDYLMIMAYLSGWQGPVLEDEDPYGDAWSPDGLSSAVHVQEIQVIEDASVDQLKQAVYQYGAVQTSLYMNRTSTGSTMTCYKESTSSYYCAETMEQDHDVLILGWDDNWSRFRFQNVPDVDGAWICLNSWGDSFGADGIFYVSYADANIGKNSLIYSSIESTDNYDIIYQTDTCGWQGNQGYDDETCWFANVYTAEAEEQLEAVGFYATAPNAEYEIYLVHSFSGVSSFDDRIYLQQGTFEYTGYYTVVLDEPQQLEEGESFAIVVKLTTPGSLNPVAVEYQADRYTQNVTLENKYGYLSMQGEEWQNTESRFGTNVCLKGYSSRRG